IVVIVADTPLGNGDGHDRHQAGDQDAPECNAHAVAPEKYGASGWFDQAGSLTRITMPPTVTTWPPRIFAVLRASGWPSTVTAPLATICLPAPPLSHTPATLSN